MPQKTDFHSRFAQALQDPQINTRPLLKPTGTANQRRRFDVYRNNRAVSLIDNLRSTYPAIFRLVGEDFFNAAARSYIDRHPPTGPVMAEYGGEFGDCMAAMPNTDSVPYLADIASLEWQRLQSYHSANSPVLNINELAKIDSAELVNLRLQRHPAFSAIQSRWPIGSIWTICTSDAESATSPAEVNMQRSESVVVTRPGLEVLTNVIPATGYLFLNALVQGKTIGDAAEPALTEDPTFDTGSHLAGLVALGVFSDINFTTE